MPILLLLKFLRRFWFLSIVDGEGGGVSEVTTEPVAAVEAPAEPAKPTSMLDAISQHLDASEAEASGQPRDERGRFAQKQAEDAAAAAAAVTAAVKPAAEPKPAEPAKPAATPEDLLKMPEGLKPESQQRFQTLVNTNKELATKIEQLEPQVSYIRETFQQHGVRREQFEQAASFIGAVNSGNLEQALRLLDQQRSEIALALGKPLPGVDVLTEHPDLRQAVDAMQITEAHAMELARARRSDAMAQQNLQQQQQRQQQEGQQQQAIKTGLTEIDQFCKQMQSTDLDFGHIEEQLLPEIQNLIRGVPPNLWKHAIETQYRLLKKVSAGARLSAPSVGGTVLRPTGAASPAASPGNTYEAMWGSPAPSA